MKKLQFKCTLLSDIILNQKAATDGPNKTLDYIPGSNFLGVAASRIYADPNIDNAKKLVIFYSGKVRFGDAHVAASDGFRSVKAPAAIFSPKLSNGNEFYVHHLIPSRSLSSREMRSKQLKQLRAGFYDFSSSDAQRLKTSTSFAIKSAYDSLRRRSEDEKMFGYESLRKGLSMFFTVEVDDDSLAELVEKALVSENARVGRSRSAQYGLVKIEKAQFKEFASSTTDSPVIDGDECIVVYADSRLIFLDEYGMPTFRPTARDFNLDGEILWDKSQVRTFQYSPWNYKRQCFDADRCGIEKGSVFVVKSSKSPASADAYVGKYRNEGFGRVFFNPVFLKGGTDGRAAYSIVKEPDNKKNDTHTPTASLDSDPNNKLLVFLSRCKERNDSSSYEMVNNWVKNNYKIFLGERFASQWGTIRSIAMQYSDWSEIKKRLYDADEKSAYLRHGVAAEKWNENQRLDKFKEFCNLLDKEENKANAQAIIINLAAEMAKKIRKEDDGK